MIRFISFLTVMGYKINKGFMWVREPNIPVEYQEVEYIESSGTQYIDTGYIITPNTEVTIDFKYTNGVNQDMIFGVGSDSTTSTGITFCSYIGSGTVGVLSYSYGLSNGTTSNSWNHLNINTDTNRYKHIMNNSSYKMYDTQGNIVSNSTPASTISTNATHSLGLFCWWETSLNGWRNITPATIYSCTVTDNGTLVRDFVPCYRKSDNVIGMYDRANNQFYTNAGTGTFTKGNDVAPTYVFKEKQFYPGTEPTPETKEQTFTLSNFSGGGGSTRFDSIAVDGDIVEIEFNGTVNCPSSSSTWADAQIGFTQSNSGGGEPGIYKTRQIGRNRSYYGDTSNGLSLNLSSSDYLNVLYQKTPAATGSYAIKIVVNSEGAVVESGTNTTNHSWTSNESTYYENIISGISYCRIYGTQMSWTNMTVKVKYV